MSIIIPQVFADAVNDSMGVALRVGRVATDFTDMCEEITQYGGSVHFPVIDRISDAEAVTKGTAIVPDTVSMTDAEAEIKQVAKSVRIFDRDQAQVKSALKDKMAEQLGQAMAKAVDRDLVEEMKENAVYQENITELTANAIENAFNVFGDDVDSDSFAGIIINSALRPIINGMNEFTSAEKTNTAVGNGIVRDGIVGLFNNIPVILSNDGTSGTISVSGSDKNAKMLFIVKKDALGYVYQKEAQVEEEREAKLLATDLVASELYAVKLVKTNGVSVLNVYSA